MGEDKFDVIIVGGGLAGLTAGIVLAEQGLEVLLIERGDYCGSKNVTGGRLYGHSLEKVIPGFAEEAPIERVIKKERISLMTEDTSVDIGITSKSSVQNRKTLLILSFAPSLTAGWKERQKKQASCWFRESAWIMF